MCVYTIVYVDELKHVGVCINGYVPVYMYVGIYVYCMCLYVYMYCTYMFVYVSRFVS
jgi:hypothetical protein